MKAENIAVYDQNEGHYLIKIPKVFSFLRNSDDVLNVIHSIVEVSAHKSLIFDHSDLEEMDLGASLLLDVVVMHLRREWIAKGERFHLAGYLPKNEEMKNIL